MSDTPPPELVDRLRALGDWPPIDDPDHPCRPCRGRGYVGLAECQWCQGTGIDPYPISEPDEPIFDDEWGEHSE